MIKEIYMPKLGMTMKEGRLVSWLKKKGDPVNKGEPVAEIMSEKITNVVEAPDAGFLENILVQEGETVEVGTVIGRIKVSAEHCEDKKEGLKPVSEEDPAGGFAGKRVKESRPVGAVRKVIGQRMAESLKNHPQGTMTTKIDMSGFIRIKDELKKKDSSITLTAVLVKAVALALEQNPLLNSSLQGGSLTIYESKNIGVAVATEEALFVPVIRDVQDKSIMEISTQLRELGNRVKEGTIQPEDMKDGTFTLSNLGMYDVEVITPIINPPEAAILAVGATKKEMVVGEDDSTSIKPMATFSLTADHAVMDGVPAARFLETIKKIAASPEEYLL